MSLGKITDGYYGRIGEEIPEQIWGDALIDSKNMLLFRGRSMHAGHAFLLKGFRLKMLETICTFDEIAQGFNYSIWSLQLANQETTLRFPGSEFIDYIPRSLKDFTFSPFVVIGQLVHFQILVEFTSPAHFERIFRSGIRVTLLGSHFRLK